MRVYVEPAPSDCRGAQAKVFTHAACQFVAELHQRFNADIEELQRRRVHRKLELDRTNATPDFLEETRHIREDLSWRVASVPERARCRKIDCGDVSPSNLELFKKALNTKANGIQVDFDDGHCPSWRNQINGHHNILQFASAAMPGVPGVGQAPILMLRPRAWNMTEGNVTVDGCPVAGPLVDFGLLMYHVSRLLYNQQSGPFFYLSKLEGYMEARLWREIFIWCEEKLGFSHGTIKACVLIENILASFECEEILYELKDHSLGLNCGIWDYCASFINKFGSRSEFNLPDRSKYVNMSKHFLRSYYAMVVGVSHKRGALATGGMNARVLPANDARLREEITLDVCRSKKLDLQLGVDGFMVHDTDLIPAVSRMIDEMIPGENQMHRIPATTADMSPRDLLTLPEGAVTIKGLRLNISVGTLFIYNWLQGNGVFVYNGSVEDSATAEISRSQVWQWLRQGSTLEDDGKVVTKSLVLNYVRDVVRELRRSVENQRLLDEAAQIFLEVICKRDFPEFITTYLSNSHTWLQATQKAPPMAVMPRSRL